MKRAVESLVSSVGLVNHKPPSRLKRIAHVSDCGAIVADVAQDVEANNQIVDFPSVELQHVAMHEAQVCRAAAILSPAGAGGNLGGISIKAFDSSLRPKAR